MCYTCPRCDTKTQFFLSLIKPVGLIFLTKNFMHQCYIGEPNVPAFSNAVNALRTFFLQKGYLEVHTQDRLSILAACEDPTTVATYQYAGQTWPLPQTGQMWLEYELLTRPEVPGVFCVSTSYRQEPNVVPGRHKIVFPMFEFESRGTVDDLQRMMAELLEHLGYGCRESYKRINYRDAMNEYGVDELEHEHEAQLCEDYGRAVFLERFPEHTSPFWNMKRHADGTSHKIDVIIDGMETFGTAERSSDPDEMRDAFHSISDGGYAQLLYDLFGKDRVEEELEDFLSHDFVPRYGGGIGVTRLISSMQKTLA